MGRKLTIPYYRPTFVQKDLSEVGADTAYLTEVTLDQVAEIFYRVKDAWFTEGSVTVADAIEYSFINQPTGGSQRVNTQESYGGATADCGARGMFMDVSIDPIPADFDSWFQSSYPVFGSSGTIDIRDIGSDELVPWTQSPTVFASPLVFGSSSFDDIVDYSFSNAFCLYSLHWGGDPNPIPFHGLSAYFTDASGYDYVRCSLFVYPEIAWVGGTGPFDPAATLYLKLFFEIVGDSGVVLSTSSLMGDTAADMNLVIGLAGDDVIVPLINPYAVDLSLKTDFKIEATEWWPYNTETDGSGAPIWDTTTGAKL